jgi:hypothetical protein
MNWFRQEFARIDRSSKALRRFGFVVGAVSLSLGLLFLLRHRNGSALLTLGLLLIGLGAVAPRSLKYLHALWIGLSLLIGWVMTRVILTVVFFLVVTPIGLLQRLLGRSNVDLGFRTGADTYWQTHKKPFAPADYRNQF